MQCESLYLSLFFLCFFFNVSPIGCSFGKNRWEGKDEIHRLASVSFPLFGFGQFIMAEQCFMLSSNFMALEGIDYVYSEWDPMMMYGLTNKTTISMMFPIVTERINRIPLTGMGNITIMCEHALYNHFDEDSNHQWTILGTVLLPTAKATSLADIDITAAQPSTTFFLGTTTHHISPQWYIYAELGALIELSSNHTRYGTAIYYNFGLGFPLRNKETSYLTILFEASGRFRPSDVTNGVINDSTGSNRLWFGPVLNWSYADFTVQFGFQYPISERFFAPRSIPSYRVDLRIFFF